MKKICLLIMALLSVCMAFSQSDATARRRYALVIGNKNYADYPLSTNVSDAQEVTDALASKEFSVTFKKNLTRSEFSEALENFISHVNSDSHSVALFYFTGHAFTENGKNYLLPVDNDKIHTVDAAKNYGFDIEADIANKINTQAQIYIIDGAYENPFKAEGSRAIGVKGGLAAAKSQRESTVGFLFSASPNMTVASPKGKNSEFAKAVVKQIKDSDSDLAATFNTIKTTVSTSTKGEQIPYSSATSLDFKFNGEELTALQKNRAIEASDATAVTSYALRKTFQSEQAELNTLKTGLSAQSEEEIQKLQQEMQEKRRLQRENDEARAKEEELAAAKRSDSANAEIAALRQEFESQASSLSGSMKKDSSAEDRISYIESMKSYLSGIRTTAAEQIQENNRQEDAIANSKISEIWNMPLSITEKNSAGEMTDDARKRRQQKQNDVSDIRNTKKSAYETEKNAQVAEVDKERLPEINRAYSKLESGTYCATSLTDALTVRVGNYDGQTGTWPLTVTSEMFGYTTLFNREIPLSYKDVTGKKDIDISKMTDAQKDAYDEDVTIYDSLFRSATPVFYVNLTYKIMKWKDASEYHFIPVKCDIVRIGKKHKTIHTVKKNNMESAEFTIFPQVEIRTDKEIKSDQERADKTLLKEEKENPSASRFATSSLLHSSSASMAYDYSQPSYSGYTDNENSYVDEGWKRKGRGTFYISGLYEKHDIFKNNYFEEIQDDLDEPYGVSGELHLTLSQGTYRFWGISGGITSMEYGNVYDSAEKKLRDDLEANVYFGKMVEGLALNIGSHFRPYFYGGISLFASPYNFISYENGEYDEDLLPGPDKVIGLHLGGGFDIILARYLMISFGVDYGWMHYLKSFKNGVVTIGDNGEVDVGGGFTKALTHPDFHRTEFSIGLGFTW